MNAMLVYIGGSSALFLMSVLAFWPIWFMSFYFIIRPLLEPASYWKETFVMGFPITGFFSVLVIATAGFAGLRKRGYTFFVPNIGPLFGLLVCMIVSFFNTTDVTASGSALIKILSSVSMYILVYNTVETERDIDRILYALVVASIIPMLYGYYQYFTGTGHATFYRGYYKSSRMDSVFYQYNTYGEFLSLQICVITMLFLRGAGKTKKLFICLAGASVLISFILSLNRGSWLGMSFAIATASLFYIKKIKLRWLIGFPLLISLVFGTVIIQRWGELKQKRAGHYSQNTFEQRVIFWTKLLPMIKEHPITGHGVGTTELVAKKTYGSKIVPHNDYLRLAFEAGIPSVAFYLLFIFSEILYHIRLAFKGKERWAINFPVMIAVLYFFIISIVQNVIDELTILPMIFVLIGICRKWNALTVPRKPVENAHQVPAFSGRRYQGYNA